ncbi:hypothetical protein CLOM_g16086 [Closterium sp. NIES-68]|nr:hypothetical protein CLOM_g16086 [Closterium sp. NIES-68]
MSARESLLSELSDALRGVEEGEIGERRVVSRHRARRNSRSTSSLEMDLAVADLPPRAAAAAAGGGVAADFASADVAAAAGGVGGGAAAAAADAITGASAAATGAATGAAARTGGRGVFAGGTTTPRTIAGMDVWDEDDGYGDMPLGVSGRLYSSAGGGTGETGLGFGDVSKSRRFRPG